LAVVCCTEPFVVADERNPLIVVDLTEIPDWTSTQPAVQRLRSTAEGAYNQTVVLNEFQ